MPKSSLHPLSKAKKQEDSTEIVNIKKTGEQVVVTLENLGWCVHPGQYIELYVNNGLPLSQVKPMYLALSQTPGGQLQVSFPVSTDPRNLKYKLANKTVGDRIRCSAPKGKGLSVSKDPLLVLAAGSALSAAKSVLEIHHEKPDIRVLYSCKKQDDIAHPELVELERERGRLLVTLTQEKVEAYLHGRIDRDAIQAQLGPNSKVFITGPDSFIAAMASELITLGFSEHRIHISFNQFRKVEDYPVCCWRDAKIFFPEAKMPEFGEAFRPSMGGKA